MNTAILKQRELELWEKIAPMVSKLKYKDGTPVIKPAVDVKKENSKKLLHALKRRKTKAPTTAKKFDFKKVVQALAPVMITSEKTKVELRFAKAKMDYAIQQLNVMTASLINVGGKNKALKSWYRNQPLKRAKHSLVEKLIGQSYRESNYMDCENWYEYWYENRELIAMYCTDIKEKLYMKISLLDDIPDRKRKLQLVKEIVEEAHANYLGLYFDDEDDIWADDGILNIDPYNDDYVAITSAISGNTYYYEYNDLHCMRIA